MCLNMYLKALKCDTGPGVKCLLPPLSLYVCSSFQSISDTFRGDESNDSYLFCLLCEATLLSDGVPSVS